MPVGKDMLTTIDEIIRIKSKAPQDFGSLKKQFDSLRDQFSRLPAIIKGEVQAKLKDRPILETFLDPDKSEGITRKNSLGLLDSIDESLRNEFDDVISQSSELESDLQSLDSEPTEDDDLDAMMFMGMGTTRVREDKNITDEQVEILRNIGDRAKNEIDVEYINRAADMVEQSAKKDPLDRVVITLVEMKSIHDKGWLNADVGQDSHISKILTRFIDDMIKQVGQLDDKTKFDLGYSIASHKAGEYLREILISSDAIDNKFDLAVKLAQLIDVKLIREVNGVYGRELERKHQSSVQHDEVQSAVEVSKPLESLFEDLQVIKGLASNIPARREDYPVEVDGRKVGRLTLEGGLLDRIKGVRKAYEALSKDDKARFDEISHDAMKTVLTDPKPGNLLPNTKRLGNSLSMEQGQAFMDQLEKLSNADPKLETSTKMILRGSGED